jgi:hypothetical protein
MERLARQERFEEASEVRDRLQALVPALARGRQERWLVEAGRLEVKVEGRLLRFVDGALVRRGDERGFPLPLPIDAVDEVRAAVSFLASARVISSDRAPAEPVDGGGLLSRLHRRLDASRR